MIERMNITRVPMEEPETMILEGLGLGPGRLEHANAQPCVF